MDRISCTICKRNAYKEDCKRLSFVDAWLCPVCVGEKRSVEKIYPPEWYGDWTIKVSDNEKDNSYFEREEVE